MCFGSNDSTCPNDNLYRIVSVKDGKVKLIKSDYANSNLLGTDGDYANSGNLYSWNKNPVNTWSACSLNKTNLNINYINNIGSDWANKIAVTTWKVGGNTWDNIYSVTPSVVYQNEITNPDSTGSTDNATEYSAKIGLMYISDYGFAASPSAWTLAMSAYSNSTATSSNWLYKNTAEWPISRTSDFTRGSFLILADGSVGGYGTNSAFAIRPVFNFEDSVVYKSGSGTSSDPIRIN